jgi:hypothetical protein
MKVERFRKFTVPCEVSCFVDQKWNARDKKGLRENEEETKSIALKREAFALIAAWGDWGIQTGL